MASGFGRFMAVALLTVSVVYSLGAGDLDAYSVAFGAGGVLSYLLGVAFKVPTRVRCNLSALSQRHLIVSGYAREIGLIEADAERVEGVPGGEGRWRHQGGGRGDPRRHRRRGRPHRSLLQAR